MINDKYFFASPIKYKKIWLAKVLENAKRTNVKEHDCNIMVKGLCKIYKFQHNEINKMSLNYFNRKVNLLYRTENTILFTIFRYYYAKDSVVKFFVGLKSKLNFRAS